MTDPFGAVRAFDHGETTYRMADLAALEGAGLCDLEDLPVSVRVLVESVLRNAATPGGAVAAADVRGGASWASRGLDGSEYYGVHGLGVAEELTVVAEDPDTGERTEFPVTAQVGTPAAVRYVEHGGILHYVLRGLLTGA